MAKQEPEALPNLANDIGDPGQKAFIDKGASALNSLLGGTTVSALANALGRYAGIGDRVLGIPGIGDIIKPTVDAIRAKLDTLAQT